MRSQPGSHIASSLDVSEDGIAVCCVDERTHRGLGIERFAEHLRRRSE